MWEDPMTGLLKAVFYIGALQAMNSISLPLCLADLLRTFYRTIRVLSLNPMVTGKPVYENLS